MRDSNMFQLTGKIIRANLEERMLDFDGHEVILREDDRLPYNM